MEWLLLPVNPAESHHIDFYMAWHGRFITLAWGILVPLGILIARFCKITRHQNWPTETDSQFWWYSHLTLQYTAGLLTLIALSLILLRPDGHPENALHAWLGWTLLGAALLQFLSGLLRGSKGGPTESDLRGDHYDMTTRRKIFEYVHKVNGYLLLSGAVIVICSGLWRANAPVWMWLVLSIWWLLFVCLFIYLQHKGHAIDTYQAVWGAAREHPGSSLKPIGWGVRRLKDKNKNPQ